MCSVLLLRQVLVDAPLAVFFVRDEDLGRGGGEAEVRADLPGVLAPRDPRAGGTWIGLSSHGFVAGLVNRRDDPLPPGAASRGRLMLEMLAAAGAEQALSVAASVASRRVHGGCRIFAGSAGGLAWIDVPAGGPAAAPQPMEDGVWLLRHRHGPEAAPAEFAPHRAEHAAEWFARATAIVAAHEPTADALCRHGARRGSVDATQAAIGRDGRPLWFRHRQGPPCGGPFEDSLRLLGG